MSATPIQRFGLTGTLIATIGVLILIFYDIDNAGNDAGLFILIFIFPTLLTSYLIYKFPEPGPGVKTVAVLSALPSFLLFFGFSFVDPTWEASVAVIPGLGALMWILAAFPESLKQSQNSE